MYVIIKNNSKSLPDFSSKLPTLAIMKHNLNKPLKLCLNYLAFVIVKDNTK